MLAGSRVGCPCVRLVLFALGEVALGLGQLLVRARLGHSAGAQLVDCLAPFLGRAACVVVLVGKVVAALQSRLDVARNILGRLKRVVEAHVLARHGLLLQVAVPLNDACKASEAPTKNGGC